MNETSRSVLRGTPTLPGVESSSRIFEAENFQEWNLLMPKLWNCGLHTPVQRYRLSLIATFGA
jgi:hypothetical protein